MAKGWTWAGRAADVAQLWGSLPEWAHSTIRAGFLAVIVTVGGYIWSRFSSLPWELLIVLSVVMLTALIWAGAGVSYILRTNRDSTAAPTVSETAPTLVPADDTQTKVRATLLRLAEYREEGRALLETLKAGAVESVDIHDHGSVLLFQQRTKDMTIWQKKTYNTIWKLDSHEAEYFDNCSPDWAPPARMFCFLDKLGEVIGKLERRFQ